MEETTFIERNIRHDSSQECRTSQSASVISIHVKWWNTHDLMYTQVKLVTAFYALFCATFGVAVELTGVISKRSMAEKTTIDVMLAIFFYLGSTAFIIYSLVFFYQKTNENVAGGDEIIMNHSHGTAYLRFGCFAFGIVGGVYYLIVAILSFVKQYPTDVYPIENGIISALTAMFILTQILFVVWNAKLVFKDCRILAPFGLMHLVATNTWMCFQYFCYEQLETFEQIKHEAHPKHQALKHTNIEFDSCQGAQCFFGSFQGILYVSAFEYSVICGGVAFVFWTNVCSKDIEKMRKHESSAVNSTNARQGTIAGLVTLSIVTIALIIFNKYFQQKEHMQTFILCITGIIYLIAIGCIGYAFYVMGELKYSRKEENTAEASSELLDTILLILGLFGELIYIFGGMLAFIGISHFTLLRIVLFLNNILRLLQVPFQSIFIVTSTHLKIRTLNHGNIGYRKIPMPGKQMVIFLLIINVILFGVNVFETQKVGITQEIIELYGNIKWLILVRFCTPLIVFYRFHSSVCLADILRKTYGVEEMD